MRRLMWKSNYGLICNPINHAAWMLQTIANNNIPFVYEHGELFSSCYSLYVHKQDFPSEVMACEHPISVLKPQVTFPIVDTFTAIQVL